MTARERRKLEEAIEGALQLAIGAVEDCSKFLFGEEGVLKPGLGALFFGFKVFVFGFGLGVVVAEVAEYGCYY